MRLIVRENIIRLIDIGDQTEFTIHFNPAMVTFYEGFINKTVERIYVTVDEFGIIHDKTVQELFALRGIEGEFGFYGPMNSHNTKAHVLHFEGESVNNMREARLLLDNDEIYEKYANTYPFILCRKTP